MNIAPPRLVRLGLGADGDAASLRQGKGLQASIAGRGSAGERERHLKPNHRGMKEIILKRKNTTDIHFLWDAAHRAPTEVRVRLVADGARVQLRGAFFVRNDETLPVRLEIIHEAPRTKSNVIVRGLVADRGNVRAHAIATLKKGAKGAETHVEAKAMLLSDQAKAELEPYLEIDEDDVRATHSALVRPLEEDEMFYLMSRGLSRTAARRILLEAFMAPVAAAMPKFKIPIPKIRRSKSQVPNPEEIPMSKS